MEGILGKGVLPLVFYISAVMRGTVFTRPDRPAGPREANFNSKVEEIHQSATAGADATVTFCIVIDLKSQAIVPH